MKVLHVTDIIADRYGGLTTAVNNFCKGQVQRGLNVGLVATNRDYPAGKLEKMGRNPINCQGIYKSFLPVTWGPLGYSPNLNRHIDRYYNDVDLIHIHGLYRYAHYSAARMAKRKGIPYVISPHGSLDPYLFNKPQRKTFKRIYEYFIERGNLQGASAIHYTACDEQSLAEGLGLYNTPGFVVPNGIDVSAYANLPQKGLFNNKWKLGSGPVVLFCGRITQKKGIDLLIPAFANLVRQWPNAKLVLAGPDNEGYWQGSLPLVRSLNIENNIILTGMLKSDEVKQAYVDADLLVLPSYTENFGMVIVEALLCGTPVLISNKVNIWREVKDSDVGVVVPCDVEAVSKALLSLFSDPEHLERYRKNAKKTAEKLYDLEVVTGKLIAEYRKVIYRHANRS